MRDHPPDPAPQRARGGRIAEPAPRADEDVDRRLRIGAKALVTSEERVLLIKEYHADGSPFWTIPGGGLKPGESLSDCLRREIREELRCRATVSDLVGSCAYRHTSRPATTVYAIFAATLSTDPDPNRAERVTDHAWREPTDLPEAVLDPVGRFIERTLTGSDADR